MSVRTTDTFTVQQLQGQLSRPEKLEAKFASFLGRVVNFIGHSESPVLSKIKDVLTSFLSSRNEMIEARNTSVGGRASINGALQEGKIEKETVTQFFLTTVEGHPKEEAEPAPINAQSTIKESIRGNRAKLRNPSLSLEEKSQIKKELAVDKEALKTTEVVTPGTFKKIAKGKAKQVWKADNDQQHAYFTPIQEKGISKIIYNRKSEIQEEVNTAKLIQTHLDEARGKEAPEEESNLALEMSEVEGKNGIEGQYTVKTKAAEGDLEKRVNKGEIKFPNSAVVGFQIANGMNNLHKAGFVHGDIKLENVLVYTENGKMQVRISDFGKTKQLGKDESAMHTGNSRYAAPEGRLTQKGEVYGTALMIIRTLEGELLADGKKMLKDPTRPDSSVKADERRGVEKFLVTNQDCPQIERNSLKGKFKSYSREVQLAVNIPPSQNLQRAESELHQYIGALVKGLAEKHSSPSEQAKIDNLGTLLRAMTQSDPAIRPTMEQVVEAYTQIMK